MDSNHQSDLRSKSAIGTKRTCRIALHMSALGVKRTSGLTERDLGPESVPHRLGSL